MLQAPPSTHRLVSRQPKARPPGVCRFRTCQELVRFLPLSPVLYSCQLRCRSRSKGMPMLEIWARVPVHKLFKTWTRPRRRCAARYAEPGSSSLDYVVGITGSRTRDYVTRSAPSAEIIRSGLCPNKPGQNKPGQTDVKKSVFGLQAICSRKDFAPGCPLSDYSGSGVHFLSKTKPQ
jgi:hypothetical protein